MTNKEQELNRYYQQIAKNLDISETMYKKAVESYEAVGTWLGGCDNEHDIHITPQGSFNLGTVIKPLHDNDDGYDIDLVCLLGNGKQLTESELKHIVGDRLKENKVYNEKLKSPEGKRCWTLEYNKFHMDILPSAPYYSIYSEPDLTQIRLTHKLAESLYIPKYSDPYSYKQWFDERMKTILNEEIRHFAAQNKVEIKDVPKYKVKTPLQQAIQLLKRHRDKMYEKDSTNAPISMIITTLAAQAYNNEPNLYEAVQSILQNMPKFIKNNNGEWWVANPVMPQENFADKWKEVPEKKVEFDRWLKSARKEMLENPLKSVGLSELSKPMNSCFGEKMVNMALADIAAETKVARENKSLYIAGVTGGLTTQKTERTKRVKEHKFFGK